MILQECLVDSWWANWIQEQRKQSLSPVTDIIEPLWILASHHGECFSVSPATNWTHLGEVLPNRSSCRKKSKRWNRLVLHTHTHTHTHTPPPPPPPPLHCVLRSGRRQLSQSVRWRLRKVSHFRDTALTAFVNMSSAHPEDTVGSVSPHLSARSNRCDWWSAWLASGTRTGARGKATQLQCEYLSFIHSVDYYRKIGEIKILWYFVGYSFAEICFFLTEISKYSLTNVPFIF